LIIPAIIYTDAIATIVGAAGLWVGIEALVIARAARREAEAANLNGKAYLDAARESANRASQHTTEAAAHLRNLSQVAKTAAAVSVDAQAAADASKNHSIAAKDYAKQTHELMGKAVTATQPVTQGHAVCSVCKHTVARYEVHPTKGVICANCKE
jgi:hypothetical protein